MSMLGVYVGNSVSGVKNFDNWLGRPADAVLAYVGRDGWTDFEGSVKYYSGWWSQADKPVLWSVPLIVNGATLEEAAKGAYNDHYRVAAQALAASRPNDEEIIIRTGWEFNAQWFPWKAAGHEQAFIDAWHEFVDTFRSISPRFKFDWSPNAGDMGMNPENAYPGDDYVDIIGLDVYYNPAYDPKDPEAAWTHQLTRSYGLQWHQDFAAAHGKPTSYSEWGVMTDNAGPYIEHFSDWFAAHDVTYQTYWDSYADYAGKLSDGHNPTAGAEYIQEFGGTPLNVITGTEQPDTLNGTARSERIDGLAGPDTMAGGLGGDTYIVNDTGDRVIEKASEGTDEVRSYVMSYTLPGNVENLTLMGIGQSGTGNAAANRIIGGRGDNVLNGGTGDDYLMGGIGSDSFVLQRGTGRDTIADFAAGIGTGDVVVLDSSGFTSFAQVKAGLEQFNKDAVLALPGGDVLVFKGHLVADFVADDFRFTGSIPVAPVWNPLPSPLAPTPTQFSRTGTANNDTLTGDDRNDFLNGAAGIDRLVGGKGHDIYVVDHTQDAVIENANEGIDTVQSWAKTYVLAANVENLQLSGNYAHTATGNGLANRITGTGNTDIVNGGLGNDYLVGKDGNDTFIMQKGTGHDVIADFSAGSGVGDVCKIDGYSIGSFTAAKAAMTQVTDGTVLDLGGGDTVFFAGVSIGSFTADDFQFANVVAAPPPAPTPPPPAPLPSGEQTAIILPNPPASPGPIQYSRTGTANNDTLTGDDRNDFINGAAGIDRLVGGKGHDIYVVDHTQDAVIENANEGIDTVQSWAKTYVLAANVENLQLSGNYTHTATGNGLANWITGTSNVDIINGGFGNDLLEGRAGNDIFIMQKGTGYDIVADFVAGAGAGDVCRLDGVGFSTFDQVHAAMVQQGADTMLYLSPSDGVLFRGVNPDQFSADDFQFVAG